MKIGLISGTHSAGSGLDLPSPVLQAFAGVDSILHCGDLECLGVLDYLEAVAPVLAVRGYEDPTEKGNRLAARSTRIVQAEDVSIGMIHDIQWPGPKIPTSPDGTRLGTASGTFATSPAL
jgi:putative phosphoesterase